VFEDDETGAQRRNVAHDVLPVLQNLCRGNSSSGDVEVSGVKRRGGADAGPHDGRQAHCQGDGSNPIINVTKGWSHCVWSDTQNVLDNFLAPSELGDDSV